MYIGGYAKNKFLFFIRVIRMLRRGIQCNELGANIELDISPQDLILVLTYDTPAYFDISLETHSPLFPWRKLE